MQPYEMRQKVYGALTDIQGAYPRTMREGHTQRQPCSEGNAGTGFLKRGETDTYDRKKHSKWRES